MDLNEFLSEFKKMESAYRNWTYNSEDVNPRRLMFFELVKDYPIEAVRKAIPKLVKDTNSKRGPTAKEFFEAVDESDTSGTSMAHYPRMDVELKRMRGELPEFWQEHPELVKPKDPIPAGLDARKRN